jgi:hypothetical protein
MMVIAHGLDGFDTDNDIIHRNKNNNMIKDALQNQI